MWAMVSDWQSLKYLLSGPSEKTFRQLPSPVLVREPSPGFTSRILSAFSAWGLGVGWWRCFLTCPRSSCRGNTSLTCQAGPGRGVAGGARGALASAGSQEPWPKCAPLSFLNRPASSRVTAPWASPAALSSLACAMAGQQYFLSF